MNVELTTDRPVDLIALEKRFELVKYSFNAAQKGLKALYDGRSIGESYRVGRIDLHIHVVWPVELFFPHTYPFRGKLCFVCKAYLRGNVANIFFDRDEMTMLVHVGESAKQAETLASVVRLEPLEKCDYFDRDTFQLGRNLIRETVWRLFNRKLDTLTDFARGLLGDGVGNLVQRVSEGVGKLSDEDANARRWAVERFRESVCVRIANDRFVVEVKDPFPEPVQMFPTPLNEEFDFIDSIHSVFSRVGAS